MSEKGDVILSNDKSILKKYENSIKMIVVMIFNILDLDDGIPDTNKILVFELFRVLFVAIANQKLFLVVRHHFMQHNIDNEDGIFYLFDCYFKLLTKNISPVDSHKKENRSVVMSFEIWKEIWEKKHEQNDRYFEKINEPL